MTPCMPLAIKLSMLPATVYISREKNTNVPGSLASRARLPRDGITIKRT